MSQDKVKYALVRKLAEDAPPMDDVDRQAVWLYELGQRFAALRTVYDERAVRAASAWLARDAQACAKDDTDRKALFELADVLLLDVVDDELRK